MSPVARASGSAENEMRKSGGRKSGTAAQATAARSETPKCLTRKNTPTAPSTLPRIDTRSDSLIGPAPVSAITIAVSVG